MAIYGLSASLWMQAFDSGLGKGIVFSSNSLHSQTGQSTVLFRPCLVLINFANFLILSHRILQFMMKH